MASERPTPPDVHTGDFIAFWVADTESVGTGLVIADAVTDAYRVEWLPVLESGGAGKTRVRRGDVLGVDRGSV